jgi:hypothetical protein
MIVRIGIIILIIFTSCQTGKLPCPHIKSAKIKKSSVNKGFFGPVTASAKNMAETEVKKEEKTTRTAGRSESKMISNVSIQEWDCPHPGQKKYMPKSVKENIRKNMQKINKADSLQHNSPKR